MITPCVYQKNRPNGASSRFGPDLRSRQRILDKLITGRGRNKFRLAHRVLIHKAPTKQILSGLMQFLSLSGIRVCRMVTEPDKPVPQSRNARRMDHEAIPVPINLGGQFLLAI